MTKEVTAEDVDAAIRHAINTAIAFEAQNLSPTEHARLKLALGESMSTQVAEFVDSMMFTTSDGIADCVALLFELVAVDPEADPEDE